MDPWTKEKASGVKRVAECGNNARSDRQGNLEKTFVDETPHPWGIYVAMKKTCPRQFGTISFFLAARIAVI